VEIYHCSKDFPSEERFGLQQQLRRAAVSAACNIVEGSARDGESEYVNSLNIAAGSASEARCLTDLSGRLKLVDAETARKLVTDYDLVCAQLHAMIKTLLYGR